MATTSSTTAANRRPNVAECTIADEDVVTVNAALTSKLYAQRYLSGSDTINYAVDAAEIVPVSGSNPYYNQYTTSWGQTLMPANSVASGISGNGTAGDPITNDLITGKSGVGGIVSPDTYGVTFGATNRDVYIDDTGKLGYVASVRDAKTEINELIDASWIFDLLPKTFRFKKQKDGKRLEEGDGPVVCGLIAEDVETVRPDICVYDTWTTDAEGQKLPEPMKKLAGVQYSQLIVPLLVELRKLRNEVDKMKKLK